MTVSDVSEDTLVMEVDDARGYSAYEIAVQEGYTGTKAEWLASLKGAKGDTGDSVTVNGIAAVNGNITVRATDINVASGSTVKISDVIDPIRENVTISTVSGVVHFDIGEAYIDNALFK